MQLIKIIRIISLLAPFVIVSTTMQAQTTDALGAYTPYSLFGVGNIEKEGTAFNISMGGIGIGVRDHRYINSINPASITERDTLSFMLDFSVIQKNSYNSDYQTKSAYNVFNMNNFTFTFPLYKKSAFIIGFSPFSNTGYKFETIETDVKQIAEKGDIKYQKYGTGSINQLFMGASMVFAKDFSIGGEFIYYFGNISRHSNVLFNSTDAYRNIVSGWEYGVYGYTGKFGLQYSKTFKSRSFLTLGATYRLGTNLKGDIARYAMSVISSSSSDTISYSNDFNTMKIASELGFGLSTGKKDKWMIGADYTTADWDNSTFVETPGIDFAPTRSHNIKAGFEYIPNRYDIRYYLKRVSYRGGAYVDKSYISLNGNQVNTFGITFGASFPVARWYNAISVAVDLGQRGMKANQLVRERYINFVISINLHDYWFQKYRYD